LIAFLFSLPDATKAADEDGSEQPLNRDQLVYEYFSKRFDELFQEKCKAESKSINYATEVCFFFIAKAFFN